MKNNNNWKRLTALAVSAMLLIPSLTASAAVTSSEGQEEIESVVEMRGAADEFVIKDGVLEWYTGNASEVVIPEGVTAIANFAFSNCDKMKSLTIPASVTDIRERVFYGCYNLQNLIVNSNNQHYLSENGILYTKDKTTLILCPVKTSGNITIPEEVTNIGNSAFDDCKDLTGIAIPKGVTSIGEWAFGNCKGLTRITIPKGVTSIGKSAFAGCENLTSMEIPEGVTSIRDKTFGGCKGLTRITIPASVDSIGKWAFNDCKGLKSVTISEGVTSIKNYAFLDCSRLESITVPASMVKIGKRAFGGCIALKSITIPKNVTGIGEAAFNRCSSLKSLKVDKNNQHYLSKNNVLYTKDKTTLVFCPIYKSGKMTLSKELTSIGSYAFANCTGLKSITIPEGVTDIGRSAFINCTGLESINIPGGLTSINDETFWGCKNLANITIPASVTDIGSYAFSGCKSLKSVTIPKSVASIGRWVFINCSKLESFKVNKNNKHYSAENDILYNKDKTTLVCCPENKSGNIIIPEGVVEIGEDAFRNCQRLTGITIPAGVTYIRSYTFEGCKALRSIFIPESVTDMEDGAFSHYENLVIYGKANSFAQTYAEIYDISFSVKEPQELSVKSSYSKSLGSKPFQLNAKITNSNGKLSYKSSDKKVVAVNDKGTATIKGTGIATITVTSKETSQYAGTATRITVKVRPAKPQAPALKASGGRKIKVSWKRDNNATGYDIQYSTDKKFNSKTTETVTIKKNKITAATLKNLTKGKMYYVRVRSYKNAVLGQKTKKLCSAWSNVKNIKVK